MKKCIGTPEQFVKAIKEKRVALDKMDTLDYPFSNLYVFECPTCKGYLIEWLEI